MSSSSNLQYLESKILTASQPRLHVLLLEGALRQCTVALSAGSQQFWGEFDAALSKTMDIVEELVRSVSGSKSDISESLEDQYAFLYREIAVSRFDMNLEKLADCAKLLEYHRETWKQVCDMADAPAAARPAVIAPHLSSGNLAIESFSLEA